MWHTHTHTQTQTYIYIYTAICCVWRFPCYSVASVTIRSFTYGKAAELDFRNFFLRADLHITLYIIVNLIIIKSNKTLYWVVLIHCIFCMFRHISGHYKRALCSLIAVGVERTYIDWMCLKKVWWEENLTKKRNERVTKENRLMRTSMTPILYYKFLTIQLRTWIKKEM